MNAQLALPLSVSRVQGQSRKRDVESAKTAAKTCRAESQRSRILSALASRWEGATTEELEGELHVIRNTLSARLRVMEKDRLVERFGVRLNRDGNPMTVWYLRHQARVVDVHVAGERL